jgi:hypothetical protein
MIAFIIYSISSILSLHFGRGVVWGINSLTNGELAICSVGNSAAFTNHHRFTSIVSRFLLITIFNDPPDHVLIICVRCAQWLLLKRPRSHHLALTDLIFFILLVHGLPSTPSRHSVNLGLHAVDAHNYRVLPLL